MEHWYGTSKQIDNSEVKGALETFLPHCKTMNHLKGQSERMWVRAPYTHNCWSESWKTDSTLKPTCNQPIWCIPFFQTTVRCIICTYYIYTMEPCLADSPEIRTDIHCNAHEKIWKTKNNSVWWNETWKSHLILSHFLLKCIHITLCILWNMIASVHLIRSLKRVLADKLELESSLHIFTKYLKFSQGNPQTGFVKNVLSRGKYYNQSVHAFDLSIKGALARNYRQKHISGRKEYWSMGRIVTH